MPVYEFLRKFSAVNFFRFITDFGNVHYLLVFLFCSFFFLRKKSDFKFLCAMMLFELVANIVLKQFFSRPRPNILWFVEETGFYFPSGHMMASTMFYGLGIYFLCKSNYNKPFKIIGTCFFSLLILIIGISRIYLGVHYASDILGGFLLSFCLLNFGIFFYQSTFLQKKKTSTSFIS